MHKGGTCTINAAVLEAAVEAVVLQDVQQASHLAEDEHARIARLQLWQQLVQQHQLPCAPEQPQISHHHPCYPSPHKSMIHSHMCHTPPSHTITAQYRGQDTRESETHSDLCSDMSNIMSMQMCLPQTAQLSNIEERSRGDSAAHLSSLRDDRQW